MEIHTLFPNNFQLSENVDDNDTLYSKYKYLMLFTELIGIEYNFENGKTNKIEHLKLKEDKMLTDLKCKFLEEKVNEDLDCDYLV